MTPSYFLFILTVSSPLFWRTSHGLKCYVCDDYTAIPAKCTGNQSKQALLTCAQGDNACYNGRFIEPETRKKYFVLKKCISKLPGEDVYKDGERPDIGICIKDDQIFRPLQHEEESNATNITSLTTTEPAKEISGHTKRQENWQTNVEANQNYTIVEMDYICVCNDRDGCNSGKRVTLTPRLVSGGVAIATMIAVSRMLCSF